MPFDDDATIRIPVQVYGQADLAKVLDGIRGISGATRGLSSDVREFIKDTRDEVNNLGSLRNALDAVVLGVTNASTAHRRLAFDLVNFIRESAAARVEADRLNQSIGRIGGRIGGAEILGRMAGIPGGGFIGSQIMYSLGPLMSSTAAAGVGAGAVGLGAVYGAFRATDDTAKYAQEQQNLAKSMGTTTQETQLLGRVAEVTGVQVSGLFTSLRNVNKMLTEGGDSSKKIREALSDLHLSASVAFESPDQQFNDILNSLKAIGDEGERERLIVNLLGESGRQLLPLVDTFNTIADTVKRTGVIMDDDMISKLVNFRQQSKELGLEWDVLKAKMAGHIIAQIDWVTNGDLPGVAIPGIQGAMAGAVGGGASGFFVGGPLGALLGALGGGFLGGVYGTARGSMAAHYGLPDDPSMPTASIPSGVGMVADQRLKDLDATKPLGRDAVENLKDDLKRLDEKIATQRQRYLAGGNQRFGLTVAGSPEEINRLEKKIAAYQKVVHDLGVREESQPPLQGTRILAFNDRQAAENLVTKFQSQLGNARKLVPYTVPGEQTSIGDIAGLERQRAGKVEAIKDAEEYQHQIRSFRELSPVSELTPQTAHSELGSYPTRFSKLHNLPAYKERLQVLLSMVGVLDTEKFENRDAKVWEGYSTKLLKDIREDERATNTYNRGRVEDADATARGAMRINAGQMKLAEERAKQSSAILSGRSTYGLSPMELLRRQYTIAQSADESSYGARISGTASQIGTLVSQSTALGQIDSDEARRKKSVVDDTIYEKNIELETLKIDATTKSIDAINKFNEAIDHAREKVRGEFASGFSGVLMGAQHGGGKGALSALKGFGEQIEGQMLKNIGEKIWDKSVGGAVGKMGAKLPDWITKGTVFEHIDPVKQNTIATDTNTAALDKNTAALYQVVGGPGGTGTGTGPSYPGWGSGTVATVGTMPGTAVGVSPGTSTPQLVGQAQSALAKLSKAFGGGISEAGSWSAITGTGANAGESGWEQAGAIAGTAGIGLAAYGGISTMAKGGARNAAGGLSATLAAIGPLTGPAAPYVEMAAAVAGIVAMVLPDPKVQRANEISKTMFTQRWEAPISQRVSAGENGGYGDFDIHGYFRESNFSPYNIVSNPYLDVPRRTQVPGHPISSFGGYQNVTGAKTPAIINYHTWNVRSMDSQDFVRNSGKIMDALDHGINEEHHPVISSMAQKLGLR